MPNGKKTRTVSKYKTELGVTYEIMPDGSRRKLSREEAASVKPRRPSLNNTARIPLFLIGVDSAKDVIFNRVRREGLIKFSNSLDQDYFSELISERVVTRFRQGAPVRVYERTRRHNEALDCFVYAFASFHGLNPNFKAIEFNINKQRNEEENKNETRPRQKTIVRNNFINSWDK